MHLAGDLDVETAPVLRQALAGIIEDQGNLAVRLDLGEMTFIDSTGLSVLVGALRQLREKGGHLTLANLRPATRKVFEIVGFSTIFDIGPGPRWLSAAPRRTHAEIAPRDRAGHR